MKVTPVKKKFNKYKIGEVFTLPNATAKVLIHVGLLREVTEDIVAEAPVVAEVATPEVEISPRTGQPKRAYRRRDMQAES